MRPRISIRGCVRPPLVRNAAVKIAKNRIISLKIWIGQEELVCVCIRGRVVVPPGHLIFTFS